MVAHAVLTAYHVKRKRQAVSQQADGKPAMHGGEQARRMYGGAGDDTNDAL